MEQEAVSYVQPPSDNSSDDDMTDRSISELSMVDPLLEQLDPDPQMDLLLLFDHLNQRFFWGFLDDVHVAWSPRLKTIGGYCRFIKDFRFCYIRLNESFLRKRPRSDLVGVLLHEMIHAMLFINDEEDDAEHGTKFCRHIERISTLTGGGIQVPLACKASNDEIRQHWWLCNGPCQKMEPNYGYIKRALNRPPSCQDSWWAHHQSTCGGTFTKVREPENYCDKGKRKKKRRNSSEESSEEKQHSKKRRVAEDT